MRRRAVPVAARPRFLFRQWSASWPVSTACRWLLTLSPGFCDLEPGATRRLHKPLHTHRTFDTEQVVQNDKAPISGALAKPSDGLEPSTLPTGERPGTAVRMLIFAGRTGPLTAVIALALASCLLVSRRSAVAGLEEMSPPVQRLAGKPARVACSVGTTRATCS